MTESQLQQVGALYESETVGYYLLIVSPGEWELVAFRGKSMSGVWYQHTEGVPSRRIA